MSSEAAFSHRQFSLQASTSRNTQLVLTGQSSVCRTSPKPCMTQVKPTTSSSQTSSTFAEVLHPLQVVYQSHSHVQMDRLYETCMQDTLSISKSKGQMQITETHFKPAWAFCTADVSQLWQLFGCEHYLSSCNLDRRYESKIENFSLTDSLLEISL